MIYRTQPKKRWDMWDFALIEAFQLLEDEKCTQCGNPVWLCRSHSNTFHFNVKDEICYATRSLENYKDSKKTVKQRADREDKKNWGKFYYTVPTPNMKDDVLPTREDFLLEKAGLVE